MLPNLRRPTRSARACRPSLAAITAALVLAPTAPSVAQDQQPVYGWNDRAPRAPTLAEWNPDVHEAPWFETWDFWMWADDGTFVMVQFLTSSFGFGVERNASGRLIVIEPGAYSRGVPTDGVGFGDRGWDWEDGDWGWEQQPLNITFRDCYVRGDGQTFEIYLRGRDRLTFFEATLELEEPMFRPGDGRLDYGWDRHHFFEQLTLPRYRFSGRVDRKEHRDDEDGWREISGVGYAEHTLTNNFPFEIAEAFQGFRALRADGLSIVFDGLTTPRDHGGRNIGWLRVALDGRQVFEAHDVAFAPNDVRTYEAGSTRYAVPWGYELRAQSGDDWVLVRVFDGDMVSAESPFARISAFLRAMLSAMMAPHDFESSVSYDAWVHIGGETAFVSGRGWSTMNFTR